MNVTVDLTLGSIEDLIYLTIIEFTLNHDSKSDISSLGLGKTHLHLCSESVHHLHCPLIVVITLQLDGHCRKKTGIMYHSVSERRIFILISALIPCKFVELLDFIHHNTRVFIHKP